MTVGSTTTVTAQTWSAIDAVPALLGDRVTGADRWLVYGPGGVPVEQTNPDGTAWWLHIDQLGSVRVATAATGASPGTVVGTRSFDAYGNPATSTGVTPLVGYAGQYHDTETGYQYLRARYYDPETAQFLTLDPAIRATGEPYGYTGNNPLNATDPSGLRCWMGKNPNGSCRGSGAVEAVREAAQDTSEFVVRNRHNIATAVAIGTCLVPAAGQLACAVASVVALGVRVQHRGGGVTRANVADSLLTFTTLGLGSAMGSLGEASTGIPTGATSVGAYGESTAIAWTAGLIPAGYDLASWLGEDLLTRACNQGH